MRRKPTTLSLANTMGPLHEAVTWYKIFPTGWQATHWDIQSLCFGGRCTLLPSGVADFVLCAGILQRAHSLTFITCHFADTLTNS